MAQVSAFSEGSKPLGDLISTLRAQEMDSYQFVSVSVKGQNNLVVFEEIKYGELPAAELIVSPTADGVGKTYIAGPVMVLVDGKPVPLFFSR